MEIVGWKAQTRQSNLLTNSTMSIFLRAARSNIETSISLPSSKSESNRVLLIDALCRQQTSQSCTLHNISTARDTVTMQRLLASTDVELDVLDAGTTMRFLTAFCAVTNRHSILTGTERMCERPIALLVEALTTLGANIAYLKHESFPPIEINGFTQTTAQIQIRGDVSSQYISALLMVAPLLPQGLELELLGEVNSRPYIQMTIELMQQFGVTVDWHSSPERNILHVRPQIYQPTSYAIESDWSGASYWYAIAALSSDCKLFLADLKPQSLQGDSVITTIGEYFGIGSQFAEHEGTMGVWLSKIPPKPLPDDTIDFSDCPDLAQTVAVLAAGLGKKLYLTGLQSLRIKETDRIAAVQTELANFGIEAVVENENTLYIAPQTLQAPARLVHTYKDHRMAMAFAPLAHKFDLEIAAPDVVEKSYPHFWEDMEKVFTVDRL
jgi:3-phosphoshikimate 1-carboxyvinyltransferase